MSKGKIIQYGVTVLVVLILLAGIFSITRRLFGASSGGGKAKKQEAQQKKSSKKESKDKNIVDEKADNSKPMTSLTVKAPQGTIREGEELQLAISYKPKGATNTRLKWSCSEKGAVEVSKDGLLTAAEDSGKQTVTVTARSTDGSNLKQSFKLRIYPAIDLSQPMVAITFDDGPNPETTNVMLDALEENYAKATFFCLGDKAEKYPEVVKREYELGMEVGTHTYAHKNLAAESEGVIDSEVSKGVASIKNAIGTGPQLMRPPYGGYMKNSKVDPRILATAKQYQLSCINWSVDTLDWKGANSDFTYQAVMKAKDGDIVLLHDIHEYNVKAVQKFVPDLIDQGFQLVTVSELYEAYHTINEGQPRNDLDVLTPGTIHNRPEFRKDPSQESSSDQSGTTGSAGQTESADGYQSDDSSGTTGLKEDQTGSEGSSQDPGTGDLDFSKDQSQTDNENFGP